VMPKGAKFIYPRKLYVVVGTPLKVAPAETQKEQRAAARALTDELHTELQRVFDLASSHTPSK